MENTVRITPASAVLPCCGRDGNQPGNMKITGWAFIPDTVECACGARWTITDGATFDGFALSGATLRLVPPHEPTTQGASPMNTVTTDAIFDLQDALGVLRDLTPPDQPIPNLTITNDNTIILSPWKWGIPSALQDDDEKRDIALAFLATWTNRLHQAGTIVKDYGDTTVAVQITLGSGWTIRAEVTAEQACTFEPVLDDNGDPVLVPKDVTVYGEPVIETQLVPVTKRVCPPSLLAHLVEVRA